MAIITISRGSFSMGKSVAEKVAEKLNYGIISREVLLDASNHYNIPEIKLEKAIHDAPGILERYSHKKQEYISYIRSALVDKVVNDNIIYHGLAGHLLLKGISHVLKVRITANMESRISYVMKRDGISAHDAHALILENDNQRRKWTHSLYGQDPWDSSLYDLTIRIDKLSIDDAVNFICQTAKTDGFTTTEKSLQKIKDMALACHVKAALVHDFPDIGVTSEYGNVLIYLKPKDHVTSKLSKRLDEIRHRKGTIYNLEVHAGIPIPEDAV
ncbi:MAG: cytidylate kinase-like family protein [Proteobacteria bacterium]|nr:cytidylate kinase-like family protein [Pseudomonadota bacterium]